MRNFKENVRGSHVRESENTYPLQRRQDIQMLGKHLLRREPWVKIFDFSQQLALDELVAEKNLSSINESRARRLSIQAPISSYSNSHMVYEFTIETNWSTYTSNTISLHEIPSVTMFYLRKTSIICYSSKGTETSLQALVQMKNGDCATQKRWVGPVLSSTGYKIFWPRGHIKWKYKCDPLFCWLWQTQNGASCQALWKALPVCPHVWTCTFYLPCTPLHPIILFY